MAKFFGLPRVKISFVRKFVLIFVIVIASFGGGYYFGFKGFKAQFKSFNQVSLVREVPPDVNANMDLFWTVWKELGDKYFDKTKLNPQDMVYGAIQGMVAAVGDPYTMFLPPVQNKVTNEDLSGSFEGVGIEIGYKGVRLAVISPLPGSPAEAAGVKPGDFIVRIKDDAKNIDESTSGISLPDAVEAIRGPAGTKVTLTLIRDGQDNPIVTDITRAKLTVPSVTLTYVGKDNSIADVKVNKFAADTDDGWNGIVEKIKENSNVKGVIVDLRNNPGGYMQGAIDLASEFIPVGGGEKSVVVIEDRGGVRTDYKVNKVGRFIGMPVVVLINGGSASASEIFAGALRDDLGAKLVGEKSFGKGTIQEPLDLAGGSGLHITVAKWLTPDGTWVHEKGLEPDFKIGNQENASGDAQLEAAVKLLSQ